jgi:hypothetical protein
MMTKLMLAAFVLSALSYEAAAVERRPSREYHKQWRVETPYWEILRRQRQREALEHQLAPPTRIVPENRETDRSVAPHTRTRDLQI